MLLASILRTSAFLPLLLPITFVSAQVDLEVITSENAVLADLAKQGDTDVNGINLANTVLEGKKIPDDIENLSNYTVYVYTAGANVTAAKTTANEDKVTDSYNEFSDELQIFMQDLVNKQNVLLLQKQAIYTQLQTLQNAYGTFAFFIADLVTDESHKDTVSQLTADGLDGIKNALDEYEDESPV